MKSALLFLIVGLFVGFPDQAADSSFPEKKECFWMDCSPVIDRISDLRLLNIEEPRDAAILDTKLELARLAGLVSASSLKYEIPITVSASLVDGSTDFTDMPVYIALSDLPAHFWTYVQSDGDDIRLFTAAYPGGTELPRHLIYIDDDGTSGTGTLFTKRTIDDAAATMIYLRYGNAGLSAPAAGDANGQYAVWTAIKQGWALTESSGTFASLVSGGQTFTIASGVSNTTGKLEKPASNQDGTSTAHGTGGAALNLTSAGTYMGWIKEATFSTGISYGMFGDQGTDGDNRYEFRPNSSATNAGFFHTRTTTNNDARTSAQIFSGSDDGTWVHFAFRHNSGTAAIYKNGVSQSMSDAAHHSTITAEDTHWIGARIDNLDMQLYFTAALANEFVLAVYRNQNAPDSYYTIGSVRSLWTPQMVL